LDISFQDRVRRVVSIFRSMRSFALLEVQRKSDTHVGRVRVQPVVKAQPARP
jgi:hypothetical protein